MILIFLVNTNFPLFDLTKLEEILIFNLFSIDLLTLLFKKCFPLCSSLQIQCHHEMDGCSRQFGQVV